MDDLISRQAAIDALLRAEALARAFGYHIVIETIRELPTAEPSEEQVKEYCRRRNLAIVAREDFPLLAAEPSGELIRCKDCKHYQFADNRAFGMPVKMCAWFGFEDVDDGDYCSFAERRSDE